MDILPQLLMNGLITGSSIALIAVGLSLIYGVLKFMNFSHGEFAMLGAYFYYYCFIVLKWTPLPSALVATVLCATLGWLMNRAIFWPMRRESQWTLLIISVGVGMLIKNSVQLVSTGETRSYFREGYESTVYHFWNDRLIVTQNQLFMFALSLLSVAALFLLLKKTKLGKAIRALSDDQNLAAVVGVSTRRTIDWIFIISSGLAGFAGILIAYENSITVNMGQNLSVIAFAAVIMGGLGSIPGALVGSYILGLLQDLLTGITIAGYGIPSSYKSLVTFSILILFLLFRPRGLLGISLEEDKSQKA